MNARVTPNTATAVTLPDTETSLDLASLNAHIATELAAGLSDPAAIRERYGLTDGQWDRLKKSLVFRNMLAEKVRELRGDLNAGRRIQLKADIVLEDAIPAYDNMIHNKDVPAQARVDAGKFLAGLAGRNAKGEGTAPAAGSGFTLNINLGGGREKLVIDGKNLPVESDV